MEIENGNSHHYSRQGPQGCLHAVQRLVYCRTGPQQGFSLVRCRSTMMESVRCGPSFSSPFPAGRSPLLLPQRVSLQYKAALSGCRSPPIISFVPRGCRRHGRQGH